MSKRDDEVRGDHPAVSRHPRRNGLPPEDSENSAVPALPADLAAVQADDALLDALGGPNPFPEGSDARLAQVLMAWRREVDSEPITRVMDTDTALAVVARARRPERRRSSGLVSFAAAAAVLVIAFSGVGVGARAAEPGDPLFPLAKVLFTEDAESKEAAVKVQAELDEASKALNEGRVGDAQDALARAQDALPAVGDKATLVQLQMEVAETSGELENQTGTDDGTRRPSSGKLDQAPGQDAPPADEWMFDSPAEEPSTSSPDEESPGQDPPTDPGSEPGGTGGEGSTTSATPQYSPPPRPAPPPPPWFAPPPPPPPPPARPESFPEG
ncbi:MAG: anti-sigma-D factor RsdA [Actinomycetota bacterium]|nr:anti-sigma-D factor RsdA [Actinomycetota bacterium]